MLLYYMPYIYIYIYIYVYIFIITFLLSSSYFKVKIINKIISKTNTIITYWHSLIIFTPLMEELFYRMD